MQWSEGSQTTDPHRWTQIEGQNVKGKALIVRLRASLKIARGPAARDIGCGQGGGEAGTSPQRAVTAEPTQATDKRPAARRVFEEKAGWLRCSSVRDRCGYPPLSRLVIQPFPRKQDAHGIFRQALKPGAEVELGSGPLICAHLRDAAAGPDQSSRGKLPPSFPELRRGKTLRQLRLGTQHRPCNRETDRMSDPPWRTPQPI